MSAEQLSAQDPGAEGPPQATRETPAGHVAELTALDQMFHAIPRYRHGREYVELLDFVSRFPQYSMFNRMLLGLQNPKVSYTATAEQWWQRFKRKVLPDARPMVILAPRTPVLLVYDLSDTYGAPVPGKLLSWRKADGKLSPIVYSTTVKNCALHEIDVKECDMPAENPGRSMRMTLQAVFAFIGLGPDPRAKYLLQVDRSLAIEDRYRILGHELGHIFCGHLGTDDLAWWGDGRAKNTAQVEVEAESVAFLVCRRRGLVAQSEKYLVGYVRDDREMPAFSLTAVLQAVAYIEEMGNRSWDEPMRGPAHRRKDAGPAAVHGGGVAPPASGVPVEEGPEEDAGGYEPGGGGEPAGAVGEAPPRGGGGPAGGAAGAQPSAEEPSAVAAEQPGLTDILSDLSPEKPARLGELKKQSLDEIGGPQVGFDPELMMLCARYGALYVEAGVRAFAKWARAILADLGDASFPYLKSAYLSIRSFPGMEGYRGEMDSAEAVEKMTDEQIRAAIAQEEALPQEALTETGGVTDGVAGGRG